MSSNPGLIHCYFMTDPVYDSMHGTKIKSLFANDFKIVASIRNQLALNLIFSEQIQILCQVSGVFMTRFCLFVQLPVDLIHWHRAQSTEVCVSQLLGKHNPICGHRSQKITFSRSGEGACFPRVLLLARWCNLGSLNRLQISFSLWDSTLRHPCPSVSLVSTVSLEVTDARSRSLLQDVLP